jgi:hypothetical protein
MFATLHSEMGTIYCGDALKHELGPARMRRGEPKISYQQLAMMLESKGYVDPKTQLPIDKSRVTSYATDRSMAPQWFLDAVEKVLNISHDWWSSEHNANVTGSPMAHDSVQIKQVLVHLAPSLELQGLKESYPLHQRQDWPTFIKVPAWIASKFVIGMSVGSSVEYMPTMRPNSLNLINVARTTLQLDKIYALTLPDGTGEYRKAVWENDRLVLRAARKRRPDIEVPTLTSGQEPQYFVDGQFLGNMPDYDPERQDRVRILHFDSEGAEVTEW